MPAQLRAMEKADLGAAHALSVEVGWPHRREDWRFVHEVGHGIVACDAGGRVMGTAMWWPFGPSFATVGMVIVSPSLQARGLGRSLVRAVFDAAGSRMLQLNATSAGLRLYESEGFCAVGEIRQHNGMSRMASPGLADEAFKIRELTETDCPRLATLDRAAYGADRRDMFTALAGKATCSLYEQDGTVLGFALCRPFGKGRVIGPIVAVDDAAAIELTKLHLAAHDGGFLRIDTPLRDGPFPRFLEEFGLVARNTVVTMARGGLASPAGPAHIFGLVNQALG